MKIMLVSPTTSEHLNQMSRPPLGLGYIAAVLENNKHQVKIIDMNIKKYDLINEINIFNPNIIGVQCITDTRFEVFEICREIKTVFPEILLVSGGPHVTFTAEDTLRNIPWIDVIVRGEGEWTMNEIADGKNLSEIKGISYKKGDEIRHNINRTPADLDDLPFPTFHLFDLDDYNLRIGSEKAINIFTSRGCPNKCVYCSASEMWGDFTRCRDPKSVLDEIRMLKDSFGYSAFRIEDDTFTLKRKHAKEILEKIIDEDLNIRFTCKARINTLDKDLIELIFEAGGVEIQPGIESGVQRVLDEIKKRITLEQVTQVMDWCNEVGISVRAWFMAGLPTETKEEVIETIKFIKNMKKKNMKCISGSGTLIYPGTALEEFARSRGYLPDDFSWSKFFYDERNLKLWCSPTVPMLDQPQLSIEDLTRIRDRYFLKWRIASILRKTPLYKLMSSVVYHSKILRKIWRSI